MARNLNSGRSYLITAVSRILVRNLLPFLQNSTVTVHSPSNFLVWVKKCFHVWLEQPINGQCLKMAILRPFLGIFFAHYINSFHKTEVLTGHFEVLNLKNLNWIKSYNIKNIFFASIFCNFVKKATENLWHINGHFTRISGHFFANYMKIFHKLEVQTINLSCLVCLNSNWIKSNDIIFVKIFFLCLKTHHFRASLQKWVLTPPKDISSDTFKMAIFQKFFWAFMRHIVR